MIKCACMLLYFLNGTREISFIINVWKEKYELKCL